MRLVISFFSAVYLVAITSVLFDLTKTGADKSFLALCTVSIVAAFIGNLLYSAFDKTNGNDSGTVSAALLVMGDAAICVIVPTLILFGVVPYVIGTLCALGAILLLTGFLTYGLIT